MKLLGYEQPSGICVRRELVVGTGNIWLSYESQFVCIQRSELAIFCVERGRVIISRKTSKFINCENYFHVRTVVFVQVGPAQARHQGASLR